MDKTDFFTRPLLLENPVQKYAWGSTTAIQKILAAKPDDRTPWAELWMGAHPKAPSMVHVNGQQMPLNELIREHPRAFLGADAAAAYSNTLPYLFKVLAASQPLSIQAHPGARQAGEGFNRENEQQIPIGDPCRNYRDPWPKPELICAIEPFGALIGFRSPETICSLGRRFFPKSLDRPLQALESQPDASGIRGFFHELMTIKKSYRAEVIHETLANARASDTPEGYWIDRLHQSYPGDAGVLAPVCLNLLEIPPGRAVFLAPGILHAYLYGTGMEIMANSDNVLRGGLTAKHVDVAELFNTLEFAPSFPNPAPPEKINSAEQRFSAPADEFCLSVISLDPGTRYCSPNEHSADILFCLAGQAEIRKNKTNTCLDLAQGQAAIVPAAAGTYEISGRGKIWKAGVPQ
ncbi:mannose-6-phosphate isomerase [Desulfosalsimonas propionicica]|uniref:mannose-6-phosphate isomerase n=1 Tax=Desulfosalsimonas propionicica TaxID=332175 RepID=A0A7W0C7S8_9BACT|nr:mannose-6-phosphate isomerase, class I [Desulfosalsimonas propionicica]MBA2880733.1 mannose-6-phosphate isomerase [Desulfosalsimonas propionicica]